jgi:hypothetical protein
MRSRSLALPWDEAPDHGWTHPGTLLLMLATTVLWLCWSVASVVAAAVWFTNRRESDESTGPSGESS